jgi:hypothetical protein
MHFDLHPMNCSYKTLFQRTQLGETLNKMSGAKSVPKGLKYIECECSIGCKNSPVQYIPDQDPIQDALQTKNKITYLELMLPEVGSKLQVAIWASGTPEHFLIHMCGALQVLNQMDLPMKFTEQVKP